MLICKQDWLVSPIAGSLCRPSCPLLYKHGVGRAPGLVAGDSEHGAHGGVGHGLLPSGAHSQAHLPATALVQAAVHLVERVGRLGLIPVRDPAHGLLGVVVPLVHIDVERHLSHLLESPR